MKVHLRREMVSMFKRIRLAQLKIRLKWVMNKVSGSQKAWKVEELVKDLKSD